MKQTQTTKKWKRSCALITLFTFLFELLLPALLPGISTALAAEGGDGAAGSASYYQQELEKFGKGKYHAGESGVMTYRYPMGNVVAAYNSEGGWSVGGHSRIARSTKWGVPTYTDADIFTLDGQELVKASESPGFPMCEAPDTGWLYHTEEENYTRILYCNPGQTDSYWKIFYQDGSWSLYGTTTDSRIEAIDKPTEQPRAWAITESRDKGDYHVTTYTYTEDSTNGSYYLDTIVSGKTATSDGYSATRLVYADRPDQRTSYRSGAKVTSTKRVTSVVHVLGCTLDGTCDLDSGTAHPVNGYNIGWTTSPQTNQSIITSITPYGSDLSLDEITGAITSGSTLPATTFDYQTYEGGFNTTNEPWTSDTTAYPLRYTTPEAGEDHVKITLDDVNNDDAFGKDVAIDGTTLVVGMEHSPMAEDAVYVYVQEQGIWSQQAELVPTLEPDYYVCGNAGVVAISGDTLVTGMPDNGFLSLDRPPYDQCGAVYVYVRNGTTWSQQAQLTRKDSEHVWDAIWLVRYD